MRFERPSKLTAEEVARYLRDFLDGTGGEWDWDDFISIRLADPDLESIRQRAATVALPISDDGRRSLLALLSEAEAQVKGESTRV